MNIKTKLKRNKIVGLVQINNGFSGQYYLPYSLGLIVSYATKNSSCIEQYDFLQPIYKRDSLQECVDKLEFADIVCFSSYVWNENISCEIARELKHKDENKIIIFGGPSVPDDAVLYLSENEFIDICVHQEGEITFSNILDVLGGVGGFNSTHGITFRDHNDVIVANDKRPRMKEFSDVPSPYLTGFFEGLIKAVGESHQWLASWETNRGCPFKCAYCDWGSATAARVSKIDIGRAIKELEWFASKKIEFVFTCDANFGMLERDLEIVENAIDIKNRTGYPKVLSVQNTKNSRERSYQVQKKLVNSGLGKTVALALQTNSDNALKAIMRDNIKKEDYLYLQKAFRAENIPTYTEMIIGLPGETYKSFSEGISSVIFNGQHNKIQFNNLSILPNAAMADPMYIEAHKIVTVDAPIVNMHGSLEVAPEDQIVESQKFVVSTKDMPVESWRKTRKFASFVELLYYTKLVQIPLLLMSVQYGVEHKQLIEKIMKSTGSSVLFVNEIFDQHIDGMLYGGAEYIHSAEILDIYWPPGEFAYIELVRTGQVDSFMREVGSVLVDMVSSEEELLLTESIRFNKFMLNLPGSEFQKNIVLEYPVNDYYRGWLDSEKQSIEKKYTQVSFRVSEDDVCTDLLEWARYVVWYGHRTGAYFFNIDSMDVDIAGHY